VKYGLVYTRRAEKDILKLPLETKERIGKTLLRFSKDPLKFAEKLTNSSLGHTAFGLAIIGLFSMLRNPRSSY